MENKELTKEKFEDYIRYSSVEQLQKLINKLETEFPHDLQAINFVYWIKKLVDIKKLSDYKLTKELIENWLLNVNYSCLPSKKEIKKQRNTKK